MPWRVEPVVSVCDLAKEISNTTSYVTVKKVGKFFGHPQPVLRTIGDIDGTDPVTGDGSPACPCSYTRLIEHLLVHARSID